MKVILLLFSQTLSLRLLPCIYCFDNPQSQVDFPSPEENRLMINSQELNRFTDNITQGKWYSQGSEVVSDLNSGLFSVTFENKEDDLIMTLKLTGKFYLKPGSKLKFTLLPSQIQTLTSSTSQIKTTLFSKSQYSIERTNSEDLACPTVISVNWIGASNQISEVTLTSKECNISLKLVLSEVSLPEVNS